MGRKVDVLTVFPERSNGFESMQEPWFLDTAPAGFNGTLDVGLPLIPKGGSVETGAAGGYDAQFEQMGRLIASKYPNAYVRIGWEMNIENWDHKATPENAEAWKAAFRKASTSLKKGGPQLRVQWVVNSGVGNSLSDATQVYPGDDVVDIIGVDAYGWANEDPVNGKGGVKEWAQFARAHGKKFSIPEWGVHRGDGGSGDNAQFPTDLLNVVDQERDNMAFISVFDEPEGYIANSYAEGQAPVAAEATRKSLDRIASTA